MGLDIDALAEAILEPTRLTSRLLAEEIDKLGKRVELLEAAIGVLLAARKGSPLSASPPPPPKHPATPTYT